MAANLELHVATSAARYPQATNYLSILTTKLKSRGTTERETVEQRRGKRDAAFRATKHNKNKKRQVGADKDW
jgi:hypothetical protein